MKLSAATGPADVRCTLFCLGRLLVRRRRMEQLQLCGSRTSCAWHLRALDRAIVSELVLAEELGLRREAQTLLAEHQRAIRSPVAGVRS